MKKWRRNYCTLLWRISGRPVLKVRPSFIKMLRRVGWRPFTIEDPRYFEYERIPHGPEEVS